MSTELAVITTGLEKPFSIEDIDFLPKGKVERDGKTLCMALPYADPRVYQDRLNKLAPGEWSTPQPIALTVGNKLVCYVTVVVCGVPHTDVGEADPGENQGTEAFAQAFKRACSQFGLGRYLYDLEKEWVPFNPQRKQIELDAAGKRAIIRKMYQKAGIAVPGTSSAHNVIDAQPETQHNSNGKAAEKGIPKDQINHLLDEYKALRPEDCTAKNWHWQKLRVALQIPTGPLPEIWTVEHVKALDEFVKQYRKAE